MSTPKRIEFYWDVGSTNTYFALHLIRPIAARHGAAVVMPPFNLGYVFRRHDYGLADEPAAKLRHRRLFLCRSVRRGDALDLHSW